MRRTLLLLAVVALAAVAVLLTPAPERPAPREQVRGPRVVKIRPAAVEEIVITIDDRRLEAQRRAGAWSVNGTRSGPPLQAALGDLVDVLTGLRAIDRFRAAADAPYGLEKPRGTIEVAGGGRRVRLVLGRLNAASSAVYARRDDAPRVLLLGVYLLSAVDRVLYQWNRERGQPS